MPTDFYSAVLAGWADAVFLGVFSLSVFWVFSFFRRIVSTGAGDSND